MSTGNEGPPAPSAPPPLLPYPTANFSSPPPSASAATLPVLPYPSAVDPAYPPTIHPQNVGGETTSHAGETSGSTVQNLGDKGPELPPYTAPPPSYTDSFPGTQPPQPQPSYPPAGYVAQAQYVAPQPQDMVRVHGAMPFHLECPKCHQEVMTNTRLQTGMLVYLVAFICILFGGIFGCCLIPFCIPGLKDVYHTCPNCNHAIGRYDRIS